MSLWLLSVKYKSNQSNVRSQVTRKANKLKHMVRHSKLMIGNVDFMCYLAQIGRTPALT